MRLSAAAKPKSGSLRRASVPALALLVLALAGCGSSSNSSSSSSTPAAAATTPAAAATTSVSKAAAGAAGAVQKLSLAANPEGQLKYNTTSLSAKAGVVSINFTNMAPLSHNVTLESPSGAVVGATPTFQGGTRTLTLSLAPGTYTFYCSVPGHRMAGMEGKLTVK